MEQPNVTAISLLWEKKTQAIKKDAAANEAGVSLKAIQDIVARRSATIKHQTLEQLADYFGVPARELILPRADLDSPSLVPPSLGLRSAYFGQRDNEKRNAAKTQALAAAEGAVVLLAKTGQSFLALDGCHYDAVSALLRRSPSNRFVAILVNPFSPPALQMYLNWVRAAKIQRGIDPYEALLKHSVKLQESLLPYHQASMRHENSLRRIRQQLELRFTSFDIGATVLWTDKCYFLEPYFQINETERHRTRLTTYEFELTSGEDMGTTFAPNGPITHLGFYLKYSLSFEKFQQGKQRMCTAARKLVDAYGLWGEVPKDEARVVKAFLSDLAKRA